MQMMLRSVSPATPGLVVSIHDVSPRTWGVVEAMSEDLKSWGVPCVSHLVVPNHHHRGAINDDPVFSAWLRDADAQGNEVVLHGYYHERPVSSGDGMLARWITGAYTAGEGEYFDLSEDEAFRRTGEGIDLLRSAGLSPTGFISPAWLLGADAGRGVARTGLQYTTRLTSVDDWVAGTSYASQSLVYSVRAAWRRGMSLAWNETLASVLRGNPLVRLGLHPPDWKYPAIREHARRCVARALAVREPMTYDQWLNRQRAISIGS
jgi:hypothetical protein